MRHPPTESSRRQPPETPGYGLRHYGRLLLVALLLFPPPLWAATINVNDGGDAVADDGVCTLPEAVQAANDNIVSGGTAGECAAGDIDATATDEILLETDVLLTTSFAAGTYGDNGLPIVDSKMIVRSDDLADVRTIERDDPDNAPDFRFFEVSTDGTLTAASVELKYGSAGRGGAIANLGGTLDLVNAKVTVNGAGYGGGIFSTGLTTLTDSTVSLNTALYDGGGLNVEEGSTSLTNSTISENHAYAGGGIGGLRYGGYVGLSNSTVSGNYAYGSGGGLFVYGGSASLTNSTMSGNGAGLGSAIYLGYGAGGGLTAPDLKRLVGPQNLEPGYVALTNTIIANSIGPDFNCYGDPSKFDLSGGGDLDDDASCLGVPTSLAGSLDPNLEDNGGLTSTHALRCVADNPAIDGTDSCTLGEDQRGFLRDDGTCDVGSYEAHPGVAVCQDVTLEADAECLAGPITVALVDPDDGSILPRREHQPGRPGRSGQPRHPSRHPERHRSLRGHLRRHLHGDGDGDRRHSAGDRLPRPASHSRDHRMR